jgi:iron(III) transport system substrate-binding protein
MRAVFLAALAISILVACESKTLSQPIVVYATGEDDTALPTWLAEFTDETGIRVTVNYGDSGANTDAVIANTGSPPADVLLTSNVADIWRAADEGALRPIQSAHLSSIPEYLRDPDGQWAALEARYAAIGVAPGLAVASPGNYADLADPKLHGQICLSSSALAVNRSLIAMLIQDLGVRPAERIVRGWQRNLAFSPFPTEAELQVAIASGSCNYGILSMSPEIQIGEKAEDRQYYVDIDGIGVARHAQNPESAHVLVDWMLKKKAIKDLAWSNGKNVGIAGWRDEEARLLAERAGYQ